MARSKLWVYVGLVATTLLLTGLASFHLWTFPLRLQPAPGHDLTRFPNFSSIPDYTAKDLVDGLLRTCSVVKLKVFVMEPKVLSQMPANPSMLLENLDILEGWALRERTALTFGIIQTDRSVMSRVARELDVRAGLSHHAVHGLDMRNVTMRFFHDNRTLTTVPMHYVWWARDDVTATPLLHVVVFRPRAGKLWHGGLIPDSRGPGNGPHTLPFNVSALTVGHEAKMVDRFGFKSVAIRGSPLWYPANATSFLQQYRDGTFMECNHVMAQQVYRNYSKELVLPNEKTITIMDTLKVFRKTFDQLGITWWISSGTFLGWYRQCDVIPYTNDVDIELSNNSYSDKITPALYKAGMQLNKRKGKVSDSLVMSFSYLARADVYFNYEEEDFVWIALILPELLVKKKLVYPKYSLNWAELSGLAVQVPDRPEAYFNAFYGQNWTQLRTSFHYYDDPHNIQENGFWTEKEREFNLRKPCDVEKCQ